MVSQINPLGVSYGSMAEQQPGKDPKGMTRKPQDAPVVGNDVPDESKERHTEIAVEVGRKVGEAHDKATD